MSGFSEATPDRPVLLTGASGALGRVLTRALAERGWRLRLTDIAPFPDPVPQGAHFTAADLEDGPAIRHLANGCGAILHFGGASVERPFETVLGPNIRGLHHVYEAARHAGARVVFASSNHAVGLHARTDVLDADCALAPDGYYGLSKAYGELMGGLYWQKHGVESVVLRIGSCFPEPIDARMLATWLSYADLARLVARSVLAPDLGPDGRAVIWATSNNARMTWWRADERARIGWAPRDSADACAEALAAKVSDDPVIERHQGGAYAAIDYSRDLRGR